MRRRTPWTGWSPVLAVLLPIMQYRSAWPNTRTGASVSRRYRPSGTAWVNSRQGGGRSCRGGKSEAIPSLSLQTAYPQRMTLQNLAPREILGRSPEQQKAKRYKTRELSSAKTDVESSAAMGLDMTAVKSCDIFMVRYHTSSPILNIDWYLLSKTKSGVNGWSSVLHLGSVCQVLITWTLNLKSKFTI